MTESDLPATDTDTATTLLTATQFAAFPGVADWGVLLGSGYAAARFLTGSFAAGLALVVAVGELAAAAGQDPDIDLRPDSVTISVRTARTRGLTSRDAHLASQISAAAAGLELRSDRSAVHHVQVAIDALDINKVRPFWKAVLGYAEIDDEELLDPHHQGPTFWFQQMDAPRTGRNRFHIDVYVPKDQVKARIDAALAAGGQVTRDQGPDWWTLADPEGNEADLAIWG